MPKSKIKFYQEGPKEIGSGDEIELTWKVVNDSEFALKNVKGLSQMMVHDFGDIDAHSKAEFSFSFKIPSIEAIKEDFGEDATISSPFLVSAPSLTFTIKNDTFTISSNTLEVSL